ncbi:MAG TPA: ABC transporter ATP-binding protein [Streptosporangiaceae bacterium]|nr:ABC transporter ATP-binding protein [Streptosporangiaceae bacterium]
MAASTAHVMRRVVLGALREHWRDTVWLAVWSAVEALPALVFGLAVAGAVDAFRSGMAEVATGLSWLGVLLAAAAAGAAGSWLAYLRLAAVVEPLRDSLVRQAVRAALAESVAVPQAVDDGVVSKITHQAEIVRDSFAGLITTVRTSALTAASALAGLVLLAPPIATLVAGPLLASLVLFAWLVRPFAARQRRYVVTEQALAAAAGAAARNLRDVTACGAQGQVGAGIVAAVRAQERAGRALARMTACRSLVLAVGTWLPVLLILASAPWLMRHGIQAGQVFGALAYVVGVLQASLNTLVRGVGGAGVRMAVTIERLLAPTGTQPPTTAQTPMTTKPASTPGPAAQPASTAAGAAPPGTAPPPGAWHGPPPAAGALRLCGVTFAYGPHAQPVIADLDLAIPAGDHLAVVGPSGIGKSTLAGLVAGLLRPSRGQVLLGGTEVGRLSPADRSRLIVLLPQEAYVFSGTLAENLTYLNPATSTADLDRALAAVGAARLAHRLGGYGADLDPLSLSAGERQLIALARAYLALPEVTVLDEATCHLDSPAQALSELAFAQRPGTLIVIAHRVTSALRARRILVLDGLQAQVGDHDSLLSRSPLYADLIGHWDAAAQPADRELSPCSERAVTLRGRVH